MAAFTKRFYGRHHVAGQLITAAELLEIQTLQQKTYCNIEADRYGLNPDGSFTPHVISGLTPSIVSGQHQIKIGRGHGWITNSLSNTDERIPVVLETDLYCDLPAPDATHPYWVHVFLQCLTAGKNALSGSSPVAVKGIDDVIRQVTTPLYFNMTTATYGTSEGTPAATPDCNVISSPAVLPIATVLITPSDTGEIPADQLYDVRWFAPGHGHICFSRNTSGPDIAVLRDWISVRETSNVEESLTILGAVWGGIVAIPNRGVFSLIPEIECVITGSGGLKLFAGVLTKSSPGFVPLEDYSWETYIFKTDGSGAETTLELERSVAITFNPVT